VSFPIKSLENPGGLSQDVIVGFTLKKRYFASIARMQRLPDAGDISKLRAAVANSPNKSLNLHMGDFYFCSRDQRSHLFAVAGLQGSFILIILLLANAYGWAKNAPERRFDTHSGTRVPKSYWVRPEVLLWVNKNSKKMILKLFSFTHGTWAVIIWLKLILESLFINFSPQWNSLKQNSFSVSRVHFWTLILWLA